MREYQDKYIKVESVPGYHTHPSDLEAEAEAAWMREVQRVLELERRDRERQKERQRQRG